MFLLIAFVLNLAYHPTDYPPPAYLQIVRHKLRPAGDLLTVSNGPPFITVICRPDGISRIACVSAADFFAICIFAFCLPEMYIKLL